MARATGRTVRSRTVGEVAELTGLTVRTLHHYDRIGLVRPSARSAAGYRLYDRADLERLQTVRVHRELGFSLTDIAALVDERFDRGRALREQRELLRGELARHRRMLEAVEAELRAYEEGDDVDDETMFEVFGPEQRELQAEAEERWGDTDAWQQSRERTRRYTADDWAEVKAESEAITSRIVAVHAAGEPADSEAAMDAVEAHRQQMSARFYDCSHAMHVGLGEMYVADPRFRATYEDLAEGLATWVRDAIRANAARAGVTP